MSLNGLSGILPPMLFLLAYTCASARPNISGNNVNVTCSVWGFNASVIRVIFFFLLLLRLPLLLFLLFSGWSEILLLLFLGDRKTLNWSVAWWFASHRYALRWQTKMECWFFNSAGGFCLKERCLWVLFIIFLSHSSCLGWPFNLKLMDANPKLVDVNLNLPKYVIVFAVILLHELWIKFEYC